MSARTPYVSVLVPIYNVEKYLDACLSSLEAQSFMDFEALLLDDGSTDASSEIAKSYADKDPRFLYIRKQNSGYGDTLNQGFSRAQGAYVGILESDDVMREGALMHMVEMVRAHDVDVYHGGFVKWWAETACEEMCRLFSPRLVASVFVPALEPSMFLAMPSLWAGLYRRAWLIREGIYFRTTAGAAFQDTSFAFKAFACAQSCVVDNVALINYRQDRMSSSIHDLTRMDAILGEYDEIFDFVKAHTSCGSSCSTTDESVSGAKLTQGSCTSKDVSETCYPLAVSAWAACINGCLWYLDRFDSYAQYDFVQKLGAYLREKQSDPDLYTAYQQLDTWRKIQVESLIHKSQRFVKARRARGESALSKLHYAFNVAGIIGVISALKERQSRL